jgi:hypothetical protein
MVPCIFFFTEVTTHKIMGPVSAAAILSVFCYSLAAIAIWKMPETYGRDLDYLELRNPSPLKQSQVELQDRE